MDKFIYFFLYHNYYNNMPLYQYFRNAIEHYFSILKAILQKMEGLTYNDLKLNIEKAIKSIPKETYKNLLIGSYKRDGEYIKNHQENQAKK